MPVDSPGDTGGSLRPWGNNFSERLRVAVLHCNNFVGQADPYPNPAVVPRLLSRKERFAFVSAEDAG